MQPHPSERDGTVLTEKRRQKVISKLSSQMSDNEIALKCGVSRSTVWRIRHDEAAKEAKRKRALARMKAKEKRAKVEAPRAVPMPPLAPPAETVERSVLPKVDAEPVTMGSYFAVQILKGESVKDVAYAVMEMAESAKALFRKLQILDCITVGTTPFARFRSDLGDPVAVLKGSNRGCIAFVDGAYRVLFDGRQVKHPTAVMLSAHRAGFGQIYAGPKIARWRAQFRTN